MKSDTRLKIFFVIMAGILWFLLSQIGRSQTPPVKTRFIPPYTQKEIYALFTADNRRYFNGLLSNDVTIGWDDVDPDSMAQTGCREHRCTIQYNAVYSASQRYVHLSQLHEMCHIETWEEEEEHGPKWEACMLRIDAAGAFRRILIDGYEDNTVTIHGQQKPF